jgi:hypothetical protein
MATPFAKIIVRTMSQRDTHPPPSRYSGERAGERGRVRVELFTVRFAGTRRPNESNDAEHGTPLAPLPGSTGKRE